MGRPFHPQAAELRVAPSPRLATGVSFLFRCPPSPAVPLGTMHPAMREELPQETPVARPPTRVDYYGDRCGHKLVVVPDAGRRPQESVGGASIDVFAIPYLRAREAEAIVCPVFRLR